MFRLAAALALTCLVPSPAFAQEVEPKKEEKKAEQEAPRSRTGRTGRFGNMGDDWQERIMKFLAKELDLDTEQEEKVGAIFKNQMTEIMSKMGQMWGRGQGGEGQAKIQKAIEEIRLDLATKISEVLTPAQKKEFERLVDNFDRRTQSFEQGQRAWTDPGQLFNPKPISKALLLGKGERSLFLGPEETAVISPFIERVIDARQALWEGRKVRRKDLMNAVDGGASEDEVRDRLETIRAVEQFQHLELVAGEHALRELLTLPQEARFVAMGLID